MPIWDKPARRLLTALQRIAQDRRERGQDEVTVETVEATAARRAVIKNQLIPITGEAVVRAGERVHVANVGGKPVAVLAHTARRSQYFPTGGVAFGIVEELFIATDPNTGLVDIFFRNDQQITPLGLSGEFAETPTRVFWGMNASVFGVIAGSVAHVFQLARPGENRVLGSQAARVRGKLYEINLAAQDYLLTTITFTVTRNSFQPHFILTGTLDTLNWTLTVDTSTFTESATMTRTLGVRLVGFNSVQFVDEVTGARSGTVAVNLEQGFINEANELLLVYKLAFGALSIRQSNPSDTTPNLTNVTMTAVNVRDDSGAEGPANLVTINQATVLPVLTPPSFDGYPFRGDPDIQGNVSYSMRPADVFQRRYRPITADVGGTLVNYFNLSDVHSVLINASRSAIVRNTIGAAPTIQAEDKVEGFRLSDFLSPNPLAAPSPGWRFFYFVPILVNALYQVVFKNDVTIIPNIQLTLNAGVLGTTGMVASQSDVSEASIATLMAPGAGLRKMFKRYTVRFTATGNRSNHVDSGLDILSDLAVIGTNSVAAVEAESKWSPGVFDRYKVAVIAQPFFEEDGVLSIFLGIVWQAQRTAINGPFVWVDEAGQQIDPSTDPHFAAVFVQRGADLITLLPFSTAPDANLRLISGGKRHVLWRLGPFWFVSDLNTSVTATAGNNADASTVDPPVGELPALVVTEPDLLYEAAEQFRYFVRGWSGDEITLAQSAANFPPRAPWAEAGVLRDLPDNVTPVGVKAVHSVVDTPALVELGVPRGT